MPDRLSRPVQIGILVADVRSTAAALSLLLAIDDWRFTSWSASADPETISTHRGTPNPDWCGELAFGTVGALQIELIQDVSGASAYREWAQRSGPGIRHIMFQVDDVASAIRLAALNGIQVSTQTSSASGVPTWAVLDTVDRFGFDVEVKADGD